MAPGDQRPSTRRSTGSGRGEPVEPRRGSRPGIHVTVSDERGRPLAGGLARWLARVAPAQARGGVNVALVSDARVRALNRKYRRKDHATDVLSFPAEQSSSLQSAQPPSRRRRFGEPGRSSRTKTVSGGRRTRRNKPGKLPVSAVSSVVQDFGFLGDIVIARGLARRQARQAGHDEATELRVLALHGLLHLLGYDHQHDNGEMARVERRLRRKAGLKDALIERAAQ
jgi:probable rRNA maturation factor